MDSVKVDLGNVGMYSVQGKRPKTIALAQLIICDLKNI
jgi:hypothetical protein